MRARPGCTFSCVGPWPFTPFVSVSLLPPMFFLLESQAPTLTKPGVLIVGRLLLPGTPEGALVPRFTAWASWSPKGHRLWPPGGLCGAVVRRGPQPSTLVPTHCVGRVHPPNLVLAQPRLAHTRAWYLIRGVGAGPPTGSSEQETLPVENTAAAEEIDRKAGPALWQTPQQECQLL